MRCTLPIVVVFLFLSGCRPDSAVLPARGPGGDYSFEVPADYETVYARIVAGAQRRHQRDNVIAGGAGVEGNLDPGQKTATIRVWSSYGTGHYQVVAHLGAVEAQRTRVRVSYALSSWKSAARQIERWAQGP